MVEADSGGAITGAQSQGVLFDLGVVEAERGDAITGAGVWPRRLWDQDVVAVPVESWDEGEGTPVSGPSAMGGAPGRSERCKAKRARALARCRVVLKALSSEIQRRATLWQDLDHDYLRRSTAPLSGKTTLEPTGHFTTLIHSPWAF